MNKLSIYNELDDRFMTISLSFKDSDFAHCVTCGKRIHKFESSWTLENGPFCCKECVKR